MRFAACIILVIGLLSGLFGILEGLRVAGMREIATHESFWQFADSCFLASIAFFLAELVHQGRSVGRGRY